MVKRLVLAVVVLGLIAAPVFAGVYYEAKTTAEGGKNAGAQNATMRAWAAGDKSKVEYLESGNPMFGKGSYMLTKDGGKEVFMVNPKDKTYFKFDMDSMMGMAGGVMKMMNMKVSDYKVETLSEGPGEIIVGLPTIHYKFHTEYKMEMSMLMMHVKQHHVSEQDIWTAPKLIDAALGIGLRKNPPKMNNEEFDKMVQAEMGKMKGFPLKMITKTTTTDDKGKSETSMVTMVVTKLDLTFLTPDSTFEIPKDYKETSMLGAGEEGQEKGKGEAENPFLKMFGGKKKS